MLPSLEEEKEEERPMQWFDLLLLLLLLTIPLRWLLLLRCRYLEQNATSDGLCASLAACPRLLKPD